MMSPEPANDRKLKPTVQEPEAGISTSTGSNDHQRKSKARRVSTDASAPIVASHQTTEAADHDQRNPKLSVEHIKKLFPDLYHSDSAKVTAALDALYMDIYENKLDPIDEPGCSFAPVRLVKEYLKRATERLPACDRVGRMNDFAELKPLNAAIDVIVLLTHRHDESRVGISMIGGVEAIVKVTESFPNCLALQENACAALRNLTYCNLGKKKALEVQTIPLLLATVKNHLISRCLCVHAILALRNVIKGGNESTKLLLSSGGFVAAIYKVRDKWPEEDSVQEAVQMLAFAMPEQTTMPSEISNESKRKPTVQERGAVVRADSDDHQSERAARRTMQMLAFVPYQEQSSDPLKDRKRKPAAQERELVASTSSDDRQTERKARRVSTDTPASTVVSQQTTEEANHVHRHPTISMESVIKLFPDLFHSDSAKARAALDTLFWDLYEDKLDQLQAAGGYVALVKVVKDCLKTATENMLACDGRVTKVEFTKLNAVIDVIVLLTNGHHDSMVGISSFGGVETIVNVMKSFPGCLALQISACKALRNLTHSHLGKNRTLEAGQTIDILLIAVKNHLVSFKLCEYAVLALRNVVRDDNLSTKLLLSSGGVAAAITVREKWINKGSVQRAVQMFMIPLLEELNSWKLVN
jgi:hypothetical protein